MAKRSKSNPKGAGRPTVITDEVIAKLTEAAAIDASVEEMCFYADISRDAYYDYLKKNPAFSDRIVALRQKPVLKARQTAVQKMTESYVSAMDYLSRKRKSEFSQRSEIDQRSVVLIGDVLKTIETQNVAQTTRQELPPPDILLDQGQGGQADSLPEKQSAGGVRKAKAQP